MAVLCTRCGHELITLPGVSEETMRLVAGLMKKSVIMAIKELRSVSQLGLRESKWLLDCPHRPEIDVYRDVTRTSSP